MGENGNILGGVDLSANHKFENNWSINVHQHLSEDRKSDFGFEAQYKY
jgi:hypothetical protein